MIFSTQGIRLLGHQVLVMTSHSQDCLSIPPHSTYGSSVGYLTNALKLYLFLNYNQKIYAYSFEIIRYVLSRLGRVPGPLMFLMCNKTTF